MKQNPYFPDKGQFQKLERHRYWRNLIKLYEESGLRRKAFCEQHGIKLDDFRRWKFRLAKIDAEKGELKVHVKPHPKKNILQGFASVHIDKIPPSEASLLSRKTNELSSEFKIILNKGTQLIVPAQFNPEALSCLLRCLGEGIC